MPSDLYEEKGVVEAVTPQCSGQVVVGRRGSRMVLASPFGSPSHLS